MNKNDIIYNIVDSRTGIKCAEICNMLDMSQSTVSGHLSTLKKTGMVYNHNALWYTSVDNDPEWPRVKPGLAINDVKSISYDDDNIIIELGNNSVVYMPEKNDYCIVVNYTTSGQMNITLDNISE